jgi:hypothetical protein
VTRGPQSFYRVYLNKVKISCKENKKFITYNEDHEANGFLVPIYNVHEEFFPLGIVPQQVYLTVIAPLDRKGPHLHYIRTGCFTCIKGNARFILKIDSSYKIFYSGEDHAFRSVLVPAGVAAALQNLGNTDAYVLNMPSPAWTPTMNDEHSADFRDFNFSKFD